ncbi:hypothetical protein VA7868_04121 [Vibrio aerogenes CECT 7868]|uniref:NAD dependent epimerase/dehydratase family protein n=1 Tax=Vibrio aerogenes CECT 7868 TaxID=1216006 RepID=A0A1M6D2D2_9VIBR|nr:pyridine nucleotide transhydrogenase [Vibrio aerogenes]SHI67445.1 hypothetical protein VA7868_04121 [Vibrio aerogenes CECT 7868]
MMERNALIGFSGFVGQTLLKQAPFEDLYRSTNISEIRGKSFNTIVCAGVSAVKWLANKEPEQDKASIDALIEHLSAIQCRQFILISTVDVFKEPGGAVESTPVDTENLHPYGLHRYQLEEFVKKHFENHLIVRLPGLVGPGLKKNVIYDFLNDNNLNAIDSRGIFQFYPMVNLWPDIQIALSENLSLIHLTAEPLSVHDIAKDGFGFEFEQHIVDTPAVYDFRTEHHALYNHTDLPYQYSKQEALLAIRAYAQSEPKK